MIDEEKQKKLIDKAKEIFGITDDCSRAGYMLPNGEMLDFGDPHRKEGGTRFKDHSEVWQVYEPFPEIKTIRKKGQCFATNYNDQFLLETGAIRLTVSKNEEISFEMFKPHKPSRKQFEALEYCSCTLHPDHIIAEFSWCNKDGDYFPTEIRESVIKDCIEGINDLTKQIRRNPYISDLEE